MSAIPMIGGPKDGCRLDVPDKDPPKVVEIKQLVTPFRPEHKGPLVTKVLMYELRSVAWRWNDVRLSGSVYRFVDDNGIAEFDPVFERAALMALATMLMEGP